MESEPLLMALKAATIIMDPVRLLFLAAGVLMGLVIGIIPGLGGLLGLSLLLPFTFGMDPFTALAMMLGLSAVTVTSDTIPAVLFSVPGSDRAHWSRQHMLEPVRALLRFMATRPSIAPR